MCEVEVLWRYVTWVSWRSVEVRDLWRSMKVRNMCDVEVYGGT